VEDQDVGPHLAGQRETGAHVVALARDLHAAQGFEGEAQLPALVIVAMDQDHRQHGVHDLLSRLLDQSNGEYGAIATGVTAARHDHVNELGVDVAVASRQVPQEERSDPGYGNVRTAVPDRGDDRDVYDSRAVS